MSAGFFFPPLLVIEIPMFLALLGELGYHVVATASRVVSVKEQRQQYQNCDVVFQTKGGVEVGVRQTENGIELVCDEVELERVEGVTKQEFQKYVTQKYTHKKITDELAKHGFTIVEEQVQDDQTIKLRVRRWD
jgi:hypothetical protein